MGLIPDEIIGEIRDRADIVAVVGQHVKLRKAGHNHKGLCPFHHEKSPSFNVNSDKGFFYCFGCQKKGDVFTFVMEFEGKSFIEAAESLAESAGVLIPETKHSPDQARQRSERTRMLEANSRAATFFAEQLWHPEHGAKARAYLEERGIGSDIAKAFQLGYAPDDWRTLGDYLTARDIPLAIASKVGLVVPQKRAGGYYDRFRDRLVCPIIATSGDVVGFSARRLEEDAEKAGAKYINSPESAVYKKSKLLFGIHLARSAFRKKGRAIVVEGNFDVVTLHQAGFEETVAPLGTALTDDQVRQLQRLADEVVLLYDGDKAGRAAAIKAMQPLLAAGVATKIINLPVGEDPDSFSRNKGAEALALLVDRAQPAVEFFINEVWAPAWSGSDHERAAALEEAAQVLKSVGNPTQRDLAIGTFAAGLGIPEQTARKALRRALQSQKTARNSGDSPKTTDSSPVSAKSQALPPPLELDILVLLADHPQLLDIAEERDVRSLLTDSRLRDMYSAAREGQQILSAAPDDLSPHIAKQVLAGNYASVTDPAHCLDEAVKRLVEAHRRTKLADLQQRAENARRRGDAELERELVREILTIRRQVD